MRKIILAIIALSSMALSAQVNLQLHYDFGRLLYPDSEADRQMVTATIEQFRPDRLGSIFYFIDFDFYSRGVKGAYMEFSREFTVWKGLAAHMEYNGGLTSGHASEYASQFQHALLVGPAYNFASSDFKRTFSVQALYKQYFKGHYDKAYPSFQLTAVWGMTFGRRDMFTFSGYVDMWRNHKADGHYNLIVAGEPQFWFNLDGITTSKTGLSIGTEVELSDNFIFPTAGSKTFYCNPTLAVKWTL